MQLTDLVANHHAVAPAESVGSDAWADGTDGASALAALVRLGAGLIPDAICWVARAGDADGRLLACFPSPPPDPGWLRALARQAERGACLFSDLRASASGAAARGRGNLYRFFAGTPLIAPDGRPSGVLCLLARAPRHGREAADRALLDDLATTAAAVTTQIARARQEEPSVAALRLRVGQLLEACRLAHIRTWELTRDDAASDAALDAAFGPIHAEDRERVRAAIRRCAAQQSAFEVEFRVRRPDRPIAFARVAGRCHLDPGGTLAKFSGVRQDISERKEAEAASLQAEKLKSIGRLTGGIAHDFNNLLTVISMNLEMLGELLPSGHEFAEYIEPARQAANSGAELTARLLAFAQRQPLRPERVPLDQFLPSLRELAVRTIGGRCTIDLHCAPDIGACLVDRAQLESALLNLIANARDAMPAGGRIVITAANATSSPPATDGLAQGATVSISVADDGIGVPPEIMDRVFEPFFTTKPVGKGTGLGLSMVLGFARQSGGRVEITSKPHRGTCVVLHLPLAAGAGAETDADRPGTPWRPPPARTLVVDDAPDVLRAVTRMCRDIGLRPTAAGSAEEAMALLRGGVPFDLLLTDVILPGRFGGAEIAHEGLRAQPSLRVLFTSGYSDAEIVNRARIGRDSEVLVKPYNRKQLLAALRRVMEHRPT